MNELDPFVHVVEGDAISCAPIVALADSIDLACELFADATQFLVNYNTHQAGCLVVAALMMAMTPTKLQIELNRRGAVIPVPTGRHGT